MHSMFKLYFATSLPRLGFHSRWNQTVGVRHPSIWVFIRKLKDNERQERLRRQRAVQGHRDLPKMKRKWRILKRRIRTLKRDYRHGRRNLDEYWRAITYVIKQYRWLSCCYSWISSALVLWLDWHVTQITLGHDVAFWERTSKDFYCRVLLSP
jgi:hypothetical protein